MTKQSLVVPVSAASGKSLEMRIEQIKSLTQSKSSDTFRNLVFTLAQKRPNLRNRGFVLAQTVEDDSVKLIETETTHCDFPISIKLEFAFIFTGQGAQYPQLGKEIFERNDLFRCNIRELDIILQSLPSATAPTWTIEQTLLDPPEVSKINHVTRSQPVCTAIQIGLVNLLRTWGVVPSAVVGHSSGEIAAAYAAGLLNTKEAILTAYFRGLAVGKLQTGGSMIAVGIGPDAAKQLILGLELQRDVCVACVNSPKSVTLSGSQGGIEHLLGELQAKKIFARQLMTGGRAYHSHLVKDVGRLYEDLLEPYLGADIIPEDAGVKMFSSVEYGTGQFTLSSKQARKAKYWRDNLENSVQFSGALQALIENGKKFHLIEVGPHAALKGPIHQVLAATKVGTNHIPYSPTLIRGQDSELAIKRLSGSLYLSGHNLRWHCVNYLGPQDQTLLYDLAPYDWDYSAGLHWYEPRSSIELRNRKYRRHELLGSAQLAGNGIDFSWRNVLRLQEAEWLSDHKIEDQVVFPASGYLAIAIEAISQVLRVGEDLVDKTFELGDVTIKSALVVQGDADARVKETEIHTNLSAQKISNTSNSCDWFEFTISSWVNSLTTLHCSGKIRLSSSIMTRGSTDVQDVEHFDEWTMYRWYEKLEDEGLCFGPQFQSLNTLRTDKNRVRTDAICTTVLKRKADKATDTMYPIHPITIDSCIQAAIMGSTAGNINSLKAFMPVFIAECKIKPSGIYHGGEATIHTQSMTTGFSTKRINCILLDGMGQPVLDFKNVRLSLYTGKLDRKEANTSLHLQRHPALRVTWKPDFRRLGPETQEQLNMHVDEFTKQWSTSLNDNDSHIITVIGSILDLVGHTKPSFRALEIVPSCRGASKHWLSLLEKETALPRIRSWDTCSLSYNGDITIDNGASGPFDVVVISKLSEAEEVWQAPEPMFSLLGDSGVIITPRTDTAISKLSAAQFTIIETRMQIVLGVRHSKVSLLAQSKEIIIVVRALI